MSETVLIKSPEAPASESASLHQLDDVWPIGKKNAYFTCVLAFLLGLFDLIDRQIMASLLPYLKTEYALSDAQLGSLMSILNISIAVLVVPSGYFIDRWSRKKMLCLMGVVWSVATGACAFAGSYAHLLAARFVCGAGEAGYNPAAQSLLAASFPRRLRTTAVGLAQFGMGIGGPLGLMLGAYIATHWGWRHAFGVVAVPGFILAFAALSLKDFKNAPARPDAGAPKTPYPVILLNLLRTPTLLCMFLGAATGLISGGMLMGWLPTYFHRVGGLPMTTASGISAAFFVCTSTAVLLGGPFMDWLRAKKADAAPLWLTGVTLCAACVNIWVFAAASPGSWLQIGALLGMGLIQGTNGTVYMGVVVDLSLPAHRASAVSLLIFIQNLFGFALGPFLTGFLSDRFELGTAMALMSCALLVAGAIFFISIFTYNHDFAKVRDVRVEF